MHTTVEFLAFQVYESGQCDGSIPFKKAQNINKTANETTTTKQRHHGKRNKLQIDNKNILILYKNKS